MRKIKFQYIFIIAIFMVILLLLLGIGSYPFRCSLPHDIKTNYITIGNKSYLLISSETGEQLRNPLYPIEFIDYKFLSRGKVGITKYKMFNLFSLIMDEPLLSTFPIMIPMDFFGSTRKVEIVYWTGGRYNFLTEIANSPPELQTKSVPTDSRTDSGSNKLSPEK